MVWPALEEFTRMARTANVVPVWEDLPGDLETPISLYLKVAAKEEYSYLLESVEGGENLARYSFIGFDPWLVLTASRGSITINEQGRGISTYQGNPLPMLEQIIQRYRVDQQEGLPRFYGGAVGYLGYDTIRYLEKLPSTGLDVLQLPDCCFSFCRVVLILDHVLHKLKVVVMEPVGEEPGATWQQAVDRISEVRRRLALPLPAAQVQTTGEQIISQPPRSNFTREQFVAAVQRAKEYITAGDILQVVLSQRWEIQLKVDPLAVYRELRGLNPSPYLYYLNYPQAQIVGSSPEMLVRVENGLVQNRPIAGTRPRGGTAAEDIALARDLEQDAKERAEHLMLVDLGRNDVSKVSKPGTVRLPQFMQVEYYSHVMHLVSRVEGQLAAEHTPLEALTACFPAGTVSGAPKVRAMEIIEELEPSHRGIYAGAIGYLGLNGNVDSCIAIRTVVVTGGKAYVQAGGGIVADSDPETEYQETVNKAQALLEALSRAQE